MRWSLSNAVAECTVGYITVGYSGAYVFSLAGDTCERVEGSNARQSGVCISDGLFETTLKRSSQQWPRF
jgi:hypothetical protein